MRLGERRRMGDCQRKFHQCSRQNLPSLARPTFFLSILDRFAWKRGGGFNRSSQHAVAGGIDDDRKTEVRTLDAAQVMRARCIPISGRRESPETPPDVLLKLRRVGRPPIGFITPGLPAAGIRQRPVGRPKLVQPRFSLLP